MTTSDPKPTWTADPARIAELERAGGPFNYREERVPPYSLPDALRTAAGVRVDTAAAWEQHRRPETLDLFAREVYGRVPTFAPAVRAQVLSSLPASPCIEGVVRHIRLTVTDPGGRTFGFPFTLVIPPDAVSVPCFLLIDNRPPAPDADAVADPISPSTFWPATEIVARGYATAIVRTHGIDPDDPSPDARARGIRGVWPAGDAATDEAGDAWGSVAAWGYGASRVLDYLVTDPAIDPGKVALIGHSRGGKAALWASARDPRFALTISNESGETGATLARRRFGETVARINTHFPHWFAGNYQKYNDREDDLPVDQHQLLALIAPRPLYVASAAADLWADPRGEFLSLAEASRVYALYGQQPISPNELPPTDAPLRRGTLAYHIRTGQHDLTSYDWQQYLALADTLWGKNEG